MALMAADTGGGDFVPIDQGTHIAVCNMVVGLGDQETTYMGETKVKPQVYIRWETPNERIEHEGVDAPRVIGKTYTLSLSEKATLRKDLESWRGKAFTEQELQGFDLFNVLGVACQITVTHKEPNGKVYANVTSVTGLPKGMDAPHAGNPLVKYSPEDTDQWEHLPEWLQTKIKGQLMNDEPPPFHQEQGINDPAQQQPF